MENKIKYFLFSLCSRERKKKLVAMLAKNRRMEEFSELFDDGKPLDPELNSQFFPFYSVTFRGKYFSIFVFPPRTLQLSSYEDRKI